MTTSAPPPGEAPSPPSEDTSPPRGWTDVRFRAVNLLLLVPLITILPFLFNQEDPTLYRPAVLLLVPDRGHPDRHRVHGRGPPADPSRGRGGRAVTGAQIVQLVVFTLLFLAVAVMGFMASRWRPPPTSSTSTSGASAAASSARG